MIGRLRGQIASGQGDHGLGVVEVVAAVHLRTHLALADGDEVVLELQDARP